MLDVGKAVIHINHIVFGWLVHIMATVNVVVIILTGLWANAVWYTNRYTISFDEWLAVQWVSLKPDLYLMVALLVTIVGHWIYGYLDECNKYK